MVNLTGRTAVVTGASRGIGEATARHLAECGARVVLAARSGERIEAIVAEIVAAGGQAIAVPCDVAKAGDVKALIEAAASGGAGVDILVNNAGLIEPIAHLADSDPEAWDEVVDVNLKGVYHGLRYAIPAMLERGGGTIVNISSGAATSALEGWSHYCATKAAVLMLTMSADKEYGDRGIRVVGLSPGTVATHMQVAIRASGINPVSQLDPSVHIPPLWVARAIAYLATPAGDAYRGTDMSLRQPEVRAAIGLETGAA